jgi:hypothetical protein
MQLSGVRQAAVLAGRTAADAIRNCSCSAALMTGVGAAIGFRFHDRFQRDRRAAGTQAARWPPVVLVRGFLQA